MALFYIWLIYTPLLILISWLLTILVDDPSKDFAYDLDIQTRIKRPPPPNTMRPTSEAGSAAPASGDDEEQEDYYGCWPFTKRLWKIWGMLLWLLLVYVSTEIYITATLPDSEDPSDRVINEDRISKNPAKR
jgi:hypothetical protein